MNRKGIQKAKTCFTTSVCTIVQVIACVLAMLLFTGGAWGATDSCSQEYTTPSIENAKETLRSLNFACAKKEALSFISVDSIKAGEAAEARILLGTIYYLELVGNSEAQRDSAYSQFLQALRNDPNWEGKIEFDLPELHEILARARAAVAQELQIAQKTESMMADSAVQTAKTSIGSKSRTWKYLAGIGGAVVVGTVAYLLLDHKSTETSGQSTPDFPPPPGK